MSHYNWHDKSQGRYDNMFQRGDEGTGQPETKTHYEDRTYNTHPQKSQWGHDYSQYEGDHRSQGHDPLNLNNYLEYNSPTQWDHSAQHNQKQPWRGDRYAYAEGTYGQALNFKTPHDHEQPQPTDSPSLSPSPSYLAVSLEMSVRSVIAPRKLLILDLNGTLLLRSKHRPRPQKSGPFRPVMRTVHPRPYLTSFRRYLFHPDTIRWLDIMIWSSAQPHSVQDMLQHCFPSPEEAENTSSDNRFIAVWARDTLGLSDYDYSRKVQTTKDLHKPWLQLAPSVNNTFRTKHSAHTTLLLDDSPLKACLQPWNHVCVPEYDAAAHVASTMALAGQAYTPSSIPPSSVPTPSSTATSPLDNILLAIIGILQALRSESNVAAWIRAGGLSSVRNGCEDSAIDSGQKAVIDVGDRARASRVDHPCLMAEAQVSPPDSKLPFNTAGSADSVSPLMPATYSRETLSPEQSASEFVAPAYTVCLSASDSPYSTSPVLSAPEPVLVSSRTYLSTTSLQSVFNTSSHHSSTSLDAEPEKSNVLWFEHVPTLTYWVAQGRSALRGLGIIEVASDGS